MRIPLLIATTISLLILATGCPATVPVPEEPPELPVILEEEPEPESVLLVGQIIGPGYVYADITEAISVSAGGDSGLNFRWSVDPPDAGYFNDTQSDNPEFLAVNVEENTDAEITVEVWSDHFDPVTRKLEFTIYPALDGWVTQWGSRCVGGMNGVGVDGSGNVYAVGGFINDCDFDPGWDSDFRESSGRGDIFLSKFDSRGNLIWVNTWGGNLDDEPRGLAVDSYGNCYVAGKFSQTVAFQSAPPRRISAGGRAGAAGGMGVGMSGTTGTSPPRETPPPLPTERTSQSQSDAFLCKYNTDGELLWVKTWGAPGTWVEVADIALDSASHIYVVGGYAGTIDLDPGESMVRTAPLGAADTFLSKFNSGGGLVWARIWGGDDPETDMGTAGAVDVDGYGNAYIGGLFAGSFKFDASTTTIEQHIGGYVSVGRGDAYLCKVSSGSEFLWCKTWGGSGMDRCMDVCVQGSAVYVTGGFEQFVDFDPSGGESIAGTESDGDAFLAKYSTGGGFQWVRTWVDAMGFACTPGGSGSVAVVGAADGRIDFMPGPGEEIRLGSSFLANYNSSGELMWAQSWGDIDDAAGNVIADSAGNIFVAGMYRGIMTWDADTGFYYDSSATDADAYIAKFLPDGSW